MSARRTAQPGICVAGAAFLLLSGCADINYVYDIPDRQSDCPTGTVYRSGGTGIVDRDGGTGIVDRNNQEVTTYCEVQVCPNGDVPLGDPGMVWHQDEHGQVLGIGVCPP